MKLSRGLFYSVGALAGAALMLESTLTRMLAVAQYYHFAFLVISLALLGFGASGSILTLFPSWMTKQYNDGRPSGIDRIVNIAGAGFAASLAAAYLVINWLPFDSYSIAWDRVQVLYFVLYYLALTLPFLFAGLGIGAVLSSSPGINHRVYAVNLLGSAFGILLGLIVMQMAGVPGASAGKRGDRVVCGFRFPGNIIQVAEIGCLDIPGGGHSRCIGVNLFQPEYQLTAGDYRLALQRPAVCFTGTRF